MNITLALGGGGAKGHAHVGAIRRLEKAGIKIRGISGTSFGGIVAVFYALGYTPDRMEQMFEGLDQNQLYGHLPEDGPSLLGLAGVTHWLKESFGDKTFEDLSIPCVLTAVDLKSGNEVLLSRGSLVEAVLATIALPAVFPARYIDDMELVDGGTLDPVPVAAARALNPRLPVVAVVLTTQIGVPAQSWSIPLPQYFPRPLWAQLGRTRYAQAMDVFMRSIDIVTRAVTHYRLQVDQPDVIVRPSVNGIDTLDVVNVREVAQKGEEAVEEVMPELRKLFGWHARLRRADGIWNRLTFWK